MRWPRESPKATSGSACGADPNGTSSTISAFPTTAASTLARFEGDESAAIFGASWGLFSIKHHGPHLLCFGKNPKGLVPARRRCAFRARRGRRALQRYARPSPSTATPRAAATRRARRALSETAPHQHLTVAAAPGRRSRGVGAHPRGGGQGPASSPLPHAHSQARTEDGERREAVHVYTYIYV